MSRMQVPAGGSGDSGAAVKRVLGLLDPAPATPDLSHGYLDLIGSTPPRPTGVAQWLMRTGAVPAIYERWWRPALGRLVTGVAGPGMAGEYRLARSWLGLSPGATLLDLACGPGNFTRELATGLGQAGLAIGLDVSASMLARAVRDTATGRAGSAGIAYVRADATSIPLRSECIDAVCCFAALHLMREPLRVLDKVTGTLRPGGRIAVMTSCRRGAGGPLGAASDFAGRMSGMTVFGRDEITDALAERGYTAIRQRIAGTVQFVAGQLEGSAA
jgi:ubiquinone/menaquinone biosynthesis C-methylase UbiE